MTRLEFSPFYNIRTMLTASHKPRTVAFPAVIIAARAAIAVLTALPFSTAFGQTYDPEHAATDSITALQAMADTTVITTSCNVIPAGSIPADRQYKFKPTQLIVPALLIGVGTTGLVSDWMKYQNREIRDELQENIDRRITIDDFTQLAPTAAMYALRLCGVHGRHGYGGMTVLAGTSAD